MAIIAQGELAGNWFARNFRLHRGSEGVRVGQQRRVRVVAGLNDETGDMVFIPAKLAPIAVSLLPHIPLACGTIFDRALQKPSLETAKKKGASTTGVDMDDVGQSRGGNPSDRPAKTEGFGFKTTASEIAEERKRKKQLTQTSTFYQAHP